MCSRRKDIGLQFVSAKAEAMSPKEANRHVYVELSRIQHTLTTNTASSNFTIQQQANSSVLCFEPAVTLQAIHESQPTNSCNDPNYDLNSDCKV